ncbi:hypothetical protein QTO34_000861 [Cnephaeus nilssonii]|uniref:Uncharacterized protein n=1 Tax=Cnephaeus nilssonii TaxID=3371016 RepID=A0AA40ID08_CNENI|nr:hypothetical protein QTO34_000861 [Eptesicus nilssonii]
MLHKAYKLKPFVRTIQPSSTSISTHCQCPTGAIKKSWMAQILFQEDILNCYMSPRSELKSMWKKMLKTFIHNFKEFAKDEEVANINSTVAEMANSLNLGVDEDDIEELLEPGAAFPPSHAAQRPQSSWGGAECLHRHYGDDTSVPPLATQLSSSEATAPYTTIPNKRRQPGVSDWEAPAPRHRDLHPAVAAWAGVSACEGHAPPMARSRSQRP